MRYPPVCSLCQPKVDAQLRKIRDRVEPSLLLFNQKSASSLELMASRHIKQIAKGSIIFTTVTRLILLSFILDGFVAIIFLDMLFYSWCFNLYISPWKLELSPLGMYLNFGDVTWGSQNVARLMFGAFFTLLLSSTISNNSAAGILMRPQTQMKHIPWSILQCVVIGLITLDFQQGNFSTRVIVYPFILTTVRYKS